MCSKSILITVFSLAFALSLNAQSPFDSLLPYGEYPVGFKRMVVEDNERNGVFDSSESRSVIINVWYPAAQSNNPLLNYGRYIIFDKDSIHPDLKEGLTTYNANMVKHYVFDKRIKLYTPAELKAYKRLKSYQTKASENANHAAGAFPLIVYHQGAGGSISDNTASCEFLASKGYVVCNAAYQYNSTKWPGVGWDLKVSMNDIDVIVETMRSFEYVNQSFGLFGHSIGGDMSLAYISQGKFKPDAIVTLDSHFGYCKDYVGRGNITELLNIFWKNIGRYDVPMLNAAAYAYFPMLDSLVNCNRTYLEVGHLGHEDFTSNGVVARDLKNTRHESVENKLVRENFKGLMVYIQAYFDHHLKDNKTTLKQTRAALDKDQFVFHERSIGENPFARNKWIKLDTNQLKQFEGEYHTSVDGKTYKCKLYIDNGRLIRVGLHRNADYFWKANKQFYAHPFMFITDSDFKFGHYNWGRFVLDSQGNPKGFVVKWFDRRGNVNEAFNKRVH